MNSNYYDIIIVGGGLAGLYSAYNIKKWSPNIRLLVLESNKKQYIGGRIGNKLFYGESLVIGAGVGRKDTDKLLIELLDELKIPYEPFKVQMNYSPLIDHPINVKKCLTELRAAYNKYKHPPNVTFKHFAKEYLGATMYNQFIVSSGYSDYENEDVYEVLYHYQMDDNSPGWTGLSIPWSQLVYKLCNYIGIHNIKSSNKVEKINKICKMGKMSVSMFKIITDKKLVYYSNKVIIATRITTVQKLLSNYPIYKEIHGQPFLYVYAKFTKTSAEIMSQHVPYYTIVPSPLQKMIPFGNGVYMIAYADNKNAESLKPFIENTQINRTFFEREVEIALGIESNTLKIIAITSFYWPIGTHYYDPLNKSIFENRRDFIKKAQHPQPGMLVVGEAVSRRQGWTEGALESVHAVLNKKWIEHNSIC